MIEPDCPKALKQIRRVVTAVGGSGRALLDFSTRPLSDGEGILINELLRRYNLYPDMLAELEALRDLLLGYAGHHQAKGDQAKADANMVHVYRIEDLLRKASPQ